MVSYNERVYAIVRRIPFGRVTTYGVIAELLGDPRKAREVGWALNTCPDDVPAHRVINRHGAVSGGSSSSAQVRRLLLEEEGVAFGPDGRCELKRYAWVPSSHSR